MLDKDNIPNKKLNLDYKELFETIMHCTNNYVFFKDIESRFIYASNYQIQDFSTISTENIVGKTDFDFYSTEIAQELYDDERKIIETEKPMLNKEERLRFLSGKTSWVKVAKFPLYDRNGNLIGIWGISIDISDQKKVEFKLAEVNKKLEEARVFFQKQSETDEMTNLFNQRKFFEEASAAYRKSFKFNRNEDNFCIAFIDVDNFKFANDSYGHQFGDFVLKEIAKIINDSIRTYDIAFRYGGDEFLILYKSSTIVEAKDITNRIRRIVEATAFSKKGNSFNTTISAGIAGSVEESDVEGLINLADKRLYNAKAIGRNTIL